MLRASAVSCITDRDRYSASKPNGSSELLESEIIASSDDCSGNGVTTQSLTYCEGNVLYSR